MGSFSGKVAVWLLACALGATVQAQPRKRILGVFYEGCEETCRGFKAGIADSGYAADVTILDLKQDPSRLPQAVRTARETQVDLVLTYGTTGTLGVVGTLDDVGDARFLHDIPVVFTVVANPFEARIAKGFEGSGRRNVAGTFNRVPEAVNIDVIRRYDPGFTKLGLLYNSNETNSVLTMQAVRAAAAQMGVELLAFEMLTANRSTPDPALIVPRLRDLKERGVRWLYVGSSSFLRANGALLTAAAIDHGIAVVSPYEDLVREHRALLSVAARLDSVGRLAAEQALRILRDGATPGDLPVVRATNFAYVVNMEVARQLNRFPPFAFLQVAETIRK